jgi:hypothetical protein
VEGKLFTIAEALRQEFGGTIKIGEPLRNAANGFIRNNVLRVQKFSGPERDKNRLTADQLPALHNAIILHALFGDTKVVRDMFTDQAWRRRKADVAEAMLRGRDSVMGIALEHVAAQRLIQALRGDDSLRRQRLPNPFSTLPQQILGGGGALLPILLGQACALSTADSILAAYLNGDWDTARTLIGDVSDHPTETAPLYLKILKECRDAQECDDLLDSWRRR